MTDVALKLRDKNEYNRDFPHSIAKEINNFIHIPDVIRSEKSLSNIERCARFDFGMLATDNQKKPICDEVHSIQSLIPFESSEKLAVVGENIFKKIVKRKHEYKGSIPSIYVEASPENESISDNALIIVRLNNFITKPMNKSCKCETFKIETESKPINVIEVNEKHWDEIVIENRGHVSFSYKWQKEEYIRTKYDFLLKERTTCFYFDTRSYILGPGDIKRLPVLFEPKRIGPHRERWYFQVEILGRSDPIIRMQMLLQGCAIVSVNNKADVIKLQNDILHEKMKILYNKSTNAAAVQNALIEKYQYHDVKMKYLYRILQTEKPLSIDALFYQCMRLEQSFREKFLSLISQTAVTLLKTDAVFEHEQMIQCKLNAYKVMYVAIDCIDLIMNTYEPDFDEACKESDKLTNSGDKISFDSDEEEQTSDYAAIREDFLEMMKPMIYNRLDWSIERILDYDLRWSECKHKIDETETN